MAITNRVQPTTTAPSPISLKSVQWLQIGVPVTMIALVLVMELLEVLGYMRLLPLVGNSDHGFLPEVFVFGVIGPFIVFLGFRWVSQILRRLDTAHHTEQELRLKLETEAEIRRALLAQTIRVQEAERHRVARELHDSLGQHLTAFLLTAEHSSSSQNPMTEHARRAAENAMDSMRRLILDLRPALLDAQGLLPALRQSAQDSLGRANINVTVTAVGDPYPIPNDIEIALFRIAQEAFTNIMRHARATRAEVRLEYDIDAVTLSVEDNGMGLAISAQNRPALSRSTGLGLLSMQERAEQLAGQMQIRSKPRQGTAVIVTIPIQPIEVESA